MLHGAAAAVGRALWKHRARHLAQAVPQEAPEPLVLPPLPVACSAKAVAVVAEVLREQEVRVVQAVVALVVEVAELAAAHTPQEQAVLVVMAGHWYWSFDHAAICRC